MHSARLRLVAALVVIGLLAACGSSVEPSASNAPTTESVAANTTAIEDTDLAAQAEAVWALPAADRDAALAAAGLDLQVAIGEVSGLSDAVGGPEALREALAASAAPIIEQAPATANVPMVFGLRSTPAPAPTIGEGMFAGAMVVALGTEGSVTSTNTLKDGESGTSEFLPPGDTQLQVTASRQSATMTMETTHTDPASGVTTKLAVKSVVAPCPGPDGTFDATATVDVAATKGSVGQTGTIDVTLRGVVDDNAALASSETDWRMQFAQFGGAPGGYVDISHSTGAGTTVNRTGGTVTADIVNTATSSGALYAAIIGHFLEEAAKAGWESGRCVRLDVTPSAGPKGLQPSTLVSMIAAPRSRIDGTPTGGNVTAHLSAGALSVEPDGSPVPADANMNYTAPDEPNRSGTVLFEARSRRGVAKAEITFETSPPAAFTIVGGLDDFQVNQAVCDVMAPFSLSGGGITANYSGGLSGVYDYTGPFGASGSGTYTISIPEGGGPGTMTGSGTGQVVTPLGVFSNSGTEQFTLTPLTDCVG